MFFKKETPTELFSCEYRKIFKNTFFDTSPELASECNISDKLTKKNFMLKDVNLN